MYLCLAIVFFKLFIKMLIGFIVYWFILGILIYIVAFCWQELAGTNASGIASPQDLCPQRHPPGLSRACRAPGFARPHLVHLAAAPRAECCLCAARGRAQSPGAGGRRGRVSKRSLEGFGAYRVNPAAGAAEKGRKFV